jgi:hypothetical protein
VSEGRYLEAESIKLRINEFKETLSVQKKRDLDTHHICEMQNLEDNYNTEIAEFKGKWDIMFNEFSQKAKKLEETLIQKHKTEIDDLIAQLELKLPKQTKFSKEYLELRQTESNLVKQERYLYQIKFRFVEAHLIRSKTEIIEKMEIEKYNKDRNEKMKIKIEVLSSKQILDKNALKQKLDIEYDMMKKLKEEEIIKITYKYRNKKTDLELQHKNEKFLGENENLFKKSIIISYCF